MRSGCPLFQILIRSWGISITTWLGFWMRLQRRKVGNFCILVVKLAPILRNNHSTIKFYMLKHFCPHMAAWHSNNNPMRLLHHLAGTNPTNQPGKPSTQVQVQDCSRLELKQSPTMPSTDLNTGCDQSQGQTTHPIKSRNTTNTL